MICMFQTLVNGLVIESDLLLTHCEHFKYFLLQASFTQLQTLMTVSFLCLNALSNIRAHTLMDVLGGNLGFSILSEDTSTCRMKQHGVELPTSRFALPSVPQ